MTTPDEVAASLTAEEIDAFCREWTSGDPEFDAPDVMLKAICKLAKQSLSPPAGMVMPMSGAVYSSVHESEDTCLTCGKLIPIPNRAYGINPDALCVCCRHDRQPSRLSARERKD